MEILKNDPQLILLFILILITFIIALIVSKRFNFSWGKFSVGMSKTEEFKNYKTISIQMNYAEMKLNLIIDLYINIFKNELEKESDNIVKTRDYINYDILLHLIKYKLLDKIKLFLKENGFYEMDQTEFLEYKKDKSEFLISELEHDLDVYYTGIAISRKELSHINSEKCSEFIYESIKEIFDNAKKIKD